MAPNPPLLAVLLISSVVVVVLLFFLLIRIFTGGFILLDRITGKSDIDKEYPLDTVRNK